jgi:AbrB family looped-hinge helix DNA binding protein
MDAVTVSPEFQIVIPRRIREAMSLHAGRKVQLVLYENRVVMIPIESPQQARGFLAGIDTTIEREEEDPA